MCVMKNAQTNCQCVSSQFIVSKTQETHSRGNTAIDHPKFVVSYQLEEPIRIQRVNYAGVRVCVFYMSSHGALQLSQHMIFGYLLHC